MKLGTSLAIGTVVGVGALLGLAALASAQSPPPLPPAPADQLSATFGHFKTLMFLIRGSDKPVSARLQTRANEIIDYVARRNAAKIWPAVTKNELETLYGIARSKA